MGWGTRPADVEPYLPHGARFVPLEGVGHFVHIEQPRLVADLVLDFLGVRRDRPTTVTLRHARIDLALHRVRDGEGRPLLLLHGLGEARRPRCPSVLDRWPGPVWGLDFTGHGASTVPIGGGYTAEILLADADAALAHIGEATVLGRGLGAWIALLLIGGARPDRGRRRGAGRRTRVHRRRRAARLDLRDRRRRRRRGDPDASPDPFALIELTRDVRPARLRHRRSCGSPSRGRRCPSRSSSRRCRDPSGWRPSRPSPVWSSAPCPRRSTCLLDRRLRPRREALSRTAPLA